MAEPYFTRRRRISLKKAHIYLGRQMCAFFWQEATKKIFFVGCIKDSNSNGVIFLTDSNDGTICYFVVVVSTLLSFCFLFVKG